MQLFCLTHLLSPPPLFPVRSTLAPLLQNSGICPSALGIGTEPLHSTTATGTDWNCTGTLLPLPLFHFHSSHCPAALPLLGTVLYLSLAITITHWSGNPLTHLARNGSIDFSSARGFYTFLALVALVALLCSALLCSALLCSALLWL